MSYFPFFVDISDRECLIVGGGKIAYRKACAVLKYGAKVLVVAPEICEEFELLKKETNVRYAIYKKYKIIYEIMGDKVYILRVIHHSQNITTNFFLQKMKSLMW